MAYDSRNAASVRHPEYIDPVSNQNSWQVQSPYSYPGGYHGAYQEAPMAPPMAPNPQNQADAWEDFPDDWPEDLNVNTTKNLSNGYSSEGRHITQQPVIQSPSPFFNPQVPSVQQSFQSTPKDSDMANVRSGLSYAAALSGKTEGKPAKEQRNSSGFDDIDLNDDSANFFSGNDNQQHLQASVNAVNDAFGLSAPMLPGAPSPSIPFSTSAAVEEEPHPADALAEAFSMSGPPKGMKVTSGINPFAKRSSPATTAHATGKVSPFDQISHIQQQPVNAVFNSFSPDPQQSCPQEQSTVVCEAFPSQPKEILTPQQNNSIANSFSSQSEESYNTQNGDAVAEAFSTHSQEVHKPKHADIVAEAFSTSSQEVFRPQQNALFANQCHGTSHEPDVVAEAFSVPTQENYRSQQNGSEKTTGQPLQAHNTEEGSTVAEAFSAQSQKVLKLPHADLVAEAFSTSSQEVFRPQQSNMVVEPFHGTSHEPDVVAEAFSAPAQENFRSQCQIESEQIGPISGKLLENDNTTKGGTVAEMFNPEQADLVAGAFSASSQEIIRPQQNDLVAEASHVLPHEPDLVAGAFLAPENYSLHQNDSEPFSAQLLQNHNSEKGDSATEGGDISSSQQNDFIADSLHGSSHECHNSVEFSSSAKEIFHPQLNDSVVKPFSDQMQLNPYLEQAEPLAGAFNAEQQDDIRSHLNDLVAEPLVGAFDTKKQERINPKQNDLPQKEDAKKISDAFFGAQGSFVSKPTSQATNDLCVPNIQGNNTEPKYRIEVTDPFSMADSREHISHKDGSASTSLDSNTELSQRSSSTDALAITAPWENTSELLQSSSSQDALPMVDTPAESNTGHPQASSVSDAFTTTSFQKNDNEHFQSSPCHDTFPMVDPHSISDHTQVNSSSEAFATTVPQQSNTELFKTSSSAEAFALHPAFHQGSNTELDNVHPAEDALNMASPQQSHTDIAQTSPNADILNNGAQPQRSDVQGSSSVHEPYVGVSNQFNSGPVELPVDYTQGSNTAELPKSQSSDFGVPTLSQENDNQQSNTFSASSASQGSVKPGGSAVEAFPASDEAKPTGVNPFRRPAPNISPALGSFVSQYSPDEHNPAFAKTHVKHQRPLNVTAPIGHGTHTMSSTGKLSTFGDVTPKEHKFDNAVINDVVKSNSGNDGPVGQDDKSEKQSQELSKPASNLSATETSSVNSEVPTPPPPVIPSTGPMAMTFRQSREKKARTPVAMSSLWSNQNSTTGAPPFMLAPALVPQTVPVEVQKPAESVAETPEPVETKKIDLHDPNLSKKERKAEKKRLKALAKEQKKALKKSNAGSSNTESQEKETVPDKTKEKGNPHGREVTPSHDTPLDNGGNPHNNSSKPHVDKPIAHGNPHPPPGSNSNYGNLPPDAQHHNPHTTGHNYGNPHGNPSPVGHHGNPHSNLRPDSQNSNPHGARNTSGGHEQVVQSDGYHGNPHGISDNCGNYPNIEGGHQSNPHGNTDNYEIQHQNIPSDSHYSNPHDLDNPRLRELREYHYYDKSPRHESSGSRSPSRQYDYDEYTYRGNKGNSGGYSPRNSRDESSRRSESPYGAYQDNPQHKNERYHGATRREMEKYGDQSAFDYPRRRRSLDYEHYEGKRPHEDSSYLDHSYESIKSDRLNRDEYYHDYHRDRYTERLDGGFKPIHPNDYRDSYRSHTPSSGSGRSSPSSYGNYPRHDQGYYGHYPPYPGYPPDPYGYYQGHYGHMPYPYYPYPPYPYDYYQHYGAYGHGSAYPSGDGSYQEQQQQPEEQPEEHALDKGQQEEVQEVKPLRTTPLHFLRPHMTCRFGAGGKLLIVLPNHPEDGMKPLVEIQKLKVVFTQEEKEQMETFPGPLTCQGTMKRQVLEFIQDKTDQIQRSSCTLAIKQAKWVLWKFFQSLVKHNGAVVADDIAEMLMTSVHLFEKKKKKRHSSSGSSSSDTSTDSSSTSSSDSSTSDSSSDDSQENTEEKPVDHLLVFRGLLLEGHSKEALDYAMKNGLWGHAVLASGLMDNKGNNSMLDTKTSSGVIQRFFATLDKGDPLITLYEHLGGKVPHSLRSHENWASNLAGIVANPTAFPDKDKDNIVTLGDTLAKQPDLLHASHLCYLLAGIRPGPKAKMVLVGCDHRNKSLNQAANIESLQLTELLEYASSLENPEYFISNLQLFRYIHAMRLMDAGLHKEALAYLHTVGDFIIKNHFAFNEVFKKSVYQTAEQLVVHMESSGTSIELFINNWLKKLKQVVDGTDSGIFEVQKDESENEEEEDPLAESSVSFFSGYDQSIAYNDKPSPESTTHSVASRQPSIQSNNTTTSGPSGHSPLSRKDSQMSVHSHPVLSRKESQLSTHSSIAPLQTLDMTQPLPTQIYQPGEPVGHKDSFSSQDQADGTPIQEEHYQSNDIFQPNDNQVQWQQHPIQDNTMNVGMGNGMFMPGTTQQNNWPIPEQVGEAAPDEGEMTPVPTFDDYYHQSNPMMANTVPSWQDDISKTPTPGMQEMLPPKQDSPPKPEPKPKQEEKKPTNEKINSGGGWFTGLSGLIQKVIPKGPNEVHLPDDTKKTIYFDKEKNKWINTDESEEDRAPPPPPPTDAMIGGGMPGIPPSGPPPPLSMPGRAMGNMPATSSVPTSAKPVPGNQRDEPGTPPSPGRAFGTGMIPDPSLPGSLPPGPPSKFSRRAQGRLGSQKKYVDVLNPNKGTTQGSPAVPSALFPILPPAGGGSFQGTLFVPSAAPADDSNDSMQQPSSIQSGGANEIQSSSQTNEDSTQSYSGTQDLNPPQQTQFFDPSSFSSQTVPSSSRRGRGRYPR